MSIELELNTRALLGISSEVTSLSGVIAFLAGVSCFAGSTCVKSANTEDASTEGICIGSSYTRAISIIGVGGAFIRGASVRGTDWDLLLTRPSLSDGKDACIRDTSIGDTCGRGACISNTSTKEAGASTDTVKHLGMDSQSFWLSEIKLLGTWLEIGVGAC